MEKNMEKPFSDRLENWIKGKQPHTLATLIDAFGDKSFAVIMFLLMLFPATPLPTAAHVLEAIVIVIAAQMVIGRRSLWIPAFLSERIKLGGLVKSGFMKKVIKRLRWLESKAGVYGIKLFLTPAIDRIFGLIIIIFTLAAFFAPPLSGLDTLPALGVVFISLAILLQNTVVLGVGLLLGTTGIILGFFFAKVIIELASRIF